MDVNCYYTCGKFIDRMESEDSHIIDQSHDQEEEKTHEEIISEDKWKFRKTLDNPKVRDILLDCIVYNCDARIEMSIDAMFEPEGNGLEAGMLRFLYDNDIEAHNLLV